MRIRAVLFDFGNVLSGPPDPAAGAEMHRILGVQEPKFHHAYWKFRDAYDRGQLKAEPYWAAVANHLQRPITAEQHRSLILADNFHWTLPNQPMIDWAALVQAAGFKIGLLSNIGDAMEVGVLERCPWLQNFDHLAFSHRLGIAKPDAAIYAHAATGLSTSPSEVLFIDDRAANIDGARAAGMHGMQYTDHARFAAAIDTLTARTGLPAVEVTR